jgi:MoxR-like ATPase
MDIDTFAQHFDRIAGNVTRAVHGKDDVVRLVVTALCSRAHVLIEDVPGVGKSILARAVAQSVDGNLNRVQCTPDLLPGDVTGSSVVDLQSRELRFRPGPVFTNVLLVDEINRATPKTQSALLEAMAERRVSVDGHTHALPDPIVVIATQNPIELAGTYPLPEAQLDRFLFKLSIGYPDLDSELAVARENAHHLAVEELGPVTDTATIVAMHDAAATVEIPEPVERYIVELVRATRHDPAVSLGAGPRASIALFTATRVIAAADGRSSVYPDDVEALLGPVLAHRIVLTPEATLRGETVVDVVARAQTAVSVPLGVGAGANGSGHGTSKRGVDGQRAARVRSTRLRARQD